MDDHPRAVHEEATLARIEPLAIHQVDDTLWSEMRQHFPEAGIIEPVAHTTLLIGFGRFNEIVGLDPA